MTFSAPAPSFARETYRLRTVLRPPPSRVESDYVSPARLAASLPPVPAEAPATMPAPVTPAVAPQPEAVAPVLSVVADNGARARAEDEQLVQMRAELAAMREMIEGEMHRLTDERLRGSPVRAQADGK